MRVAAALVVIAALGALTAFALPHAGRAANPRLIATVGTGDAYVITLTDTDGHDFKSLPAGTYDIEVHDNSAFHDFHLTGPGVDESTTVPETKTVTWTVTLSEGAYHYQCDPHYLTMNGDFTVTAATTTSTTTTTTTEPTTTAPTTTAPTATTTPKGRAPCRVPAVVGRMLPTARRTIVRARCRVGRVSSRRSRKTKGRVLAQKPRARTQVAVGTRVNLVVSRGLRR